MLLNDATCWVWKYTGYFRTNARQTRCALRAMRHKHTPLNLQTRKKRRRKVCRLANLILAISSRAINVTPENGHLVQDLNFYLGGFIQFGNTEWARPNPDSSSGSESESGGRGNAYQRFPHRWVLLNFPKRPIPFVKKWGNTACRLRYRILSVISFRDTYDVCRTFLDFVYSAKSLWL